MFISSYYKIITKISIFNPNTVDIAYVRKITSSHSDTWSTFGLVYEIELFLVKDFSNSYDNIPPAHK